eukprot:9708106-Heterocapsa_arctica.AAC.1
MGSRCPVAADGRHPCACPCRQRGRRPLGPMDRGCVQRARPDRSGLGTLGRCPTGQLVRLRC